MKNARNPTPARIALVAFAANVTTLLRSSTSSTIGLRAMTCTFGIRRASGIAARCTAAATMSTVSVDVRFNRSAPTAPATPPTSAVALDSRAFSATSRSSFPTSHGTSELFAIDAALLSTSTANASGKNASVRSSNATSTIAAALPTFVTAMSPRWLPGKRSMTVPTNGPTTANGANVSKR